MILSPILATDQVDHTPPSLRFDRGCFEQYARNSPFSFINISNSVLFSWPQIGWKRVVHAGRMHSIQPFGRLQMTHSVPRICSIAWDVFIMPRIRAASSNWDPGAHNAQTTCAQPPSTVFFSALTGRVSGHSTQRSVFYTKYDLSKGNIPLLCRCAYRLFRFRGCIRAIVAIPRDIAFGNRFDAVAKLSERVRSV